MVRYTEAEIQELLSQGNVKVIGGEVDVLAAGGTPAPDEPGTKGVDGVRVRHASDARRDRVERMAETLNFAVLGRIEREYRPIAGRRWRIDIAYPDERVAVEYEGDTWQVTGKSRHTTGAGYRRDVDKYNELALAGWLLIRITVDMVDDGSYLALVERAIAAAKRTKETPQP